MNHHGPALHTRPVPASPESAHCAGDHTPGGQQHTRPTPPRLRRRTVPLPSAVPPPPLTRPELPTVLLATHQVDSSTFDRRHPDRIGPPAPGRSARATRE